MADEAQATPGPLTASVVDQLREKAQIEEAGEAAAADAARDRERIDRRKAEEQGTVLRHTGGELRVKPPTGDRAREIERREQRARAWLPIAAVGTVITWTGWAGRGLRGAILMALGASTIAFAVALRGPSPASKRPPSRRDAPRSVNASH